MTTSETNLLDVLRRGLETHGGVVSAAFHDRHWTVGIEFGQEAEDSPMAGGAAYGMGDTLAEALTAAVDETGWR